MIFDDTSILDDLSNEYNEQKNDSFIEGSMKEKRNMKMREDYFNKYQFMYSGGNKELPPGSIDGSLKGILLLNLLKIY